ncbi:MAG: D-sedoheptulose 7-phosphate isomerase [Pseudomonadota bacterium]
MSPPSAAVNDAIQHAVRDHLEVVAALSPLLPAVERLGERMRASLRQGGKVVWMGNGGSAADSQHLAAEMVGRYRRERRGLAAIALTTDSSILTSVGNDYGFDHVFARQVEALCTERDVVVGISTSGNSRNVLAGLEAARALGAHTAGLLGGDGGCIRTLCDSPLVVPSADTPRIQEAHILIGHILCDLIDAEADLG